MMLTSRVKLSSKNRNFWHLEMNFLRLKLVSYATHIFNVILKLCMQLKLLNLDCYNYNHSTQIGVKLELVSAMT